MVLLVLFWGLAFVAIKQALAYMSWITLTFLRFAVADGLFVGYLVATRQIRQPPARVDLPMLVLLAFFGFTGYHLFLNLGETDPNVSAGTAALIIASAPAFWPTSRRWGSRVGLPCYTSVSSPHSSGTGSGSAPWSGSPPRRPAPTSTRARLSRSSAGLWSSGSR